jgi:thiamine-monophosphate kinase
VFVSGSIGDAALGLVLRKGEGADWNLDPAQRQHLVSRYLLPQPRNALAEAVRTHASASMDVSDGLVGDLAKLCRVSQVAADIDVALVPHSDAAKAVIARDAGVRETALTGGDDYEILCTVPLGKADGFRAVAKAANVPVTKIGVIVEGEGAHFRDAQGNPLAFKHAAFSHF